MSNKHTNVGNCSHNIMTSLLVAERHIYIRQNAQKPAQKKPAPSSRARQRARCLNHLWLPKPKVQIAPLFNRKLCNQPPCPTNTHPTPHTPPHIPPPPPPHPKTNQAKPGRVARSSMRLRPNSRRCAFSMAEFGGFFVLVRGVFFESICGWGSISEGVTLGRWGGWGSISAGVHKWVGVLCHSGGGCTSRFMAYFVHPSQHYGNACDK